MKPLPSIFLMCYLLINNVFQECSASKILVYIPLPFYSHQAAFRPLWKELANRGHHLTLLTLNPMENHENITQIDLSIIYKVLEEKNYFDILSSGEQTMKNVHYIFNLAIDMVDVELSHPKVQELVNGNGHFDLVITEFYCPVGTAFAYKYNCPVIGVVSMDATLDRHSMLGNPSHPILYPALDLGFSGRLSFKQRLISTFFYLAWNQYSKYLRSRGDAIVKKHFGEDMPNMYDLEKNVSMFFINSNPAFHTVRPLGPQTINVGGGLQIERPKPLPADIQAYLDESSEGVIYFSLGSSIRSCQLSQNTKSVIVDTFAQLPYKIIWKFEKEHNDTFDIPGNVRTMKWVPQQDVLRHPHVKLFITQGGLQSLEEALFSGVPVLVLPFFGDQILNAQKVMEHNLGLSLDHTALEVEKFKNAILEIIVNNSYKNSVLRLAKQLSDQPMTGIERAAWWTEYVLRNRNVDILKHSYVDIPLYQYCFLDIILCCLCVCLVMLYFLRTVYKILVLAVTYLLNIRRGRKFKKD